ncbi:hypothetical protein PGT21_011722 [Puccinia graminis f. sp. tritici]|uniref:Elongator complex protein 4 n=1 Tax=Puccinia graminis f. sp. tritici TaxID=56615 RepID=A0A5B0NMG9_PUCGR|nr:hypothetical protein PGT21_011722 [Puccinia graminis f. sp. tritici]KAA1089983.1 hypothetical protein PGTUg99_032418 [Puccinia graminis f. sp. tritici]
MSLFKRNLKPNNPNQAPSSYPTGFHPSHYNGVPTASTGIASLDDLLRGGLQISSSFLIDEGGDRGYGKLILRYSISQGIVSKQHLIGLMSLDESDEPLESRL